MIIVYAIVLSVASASAAPETPAHPYAVSIRDFGAMGDGQTDDAPAIQQALDSPSPMVVIPEGNYVIGTTLLVDSGKTVHDHREAVIRLADGAGQDVSDFLLTNRDHDTGNTHITIIGGIWDGNNEHNKRGPDGSPESYTGVAINFVNVEHLRLADLTVRNPDSFSIRLGEVRHFAVENIVFDHPVSRPNQDGVHVGGFSEDGYIRNLRAATPNTTNDDMVALNADDDVERCLNLGMKRGPIRNIHVEGVYAESVYTFVRLLSETQLLENIRIRDIAGGCRMYAINMNNWRFDKKSGDIRNVRVEDVNVTKTGPENDRPLIIVQLQVHDLVVENFRRNPIDSSGASTLLVANSADKTLEFDTASERQIEEIREQSKRAGTGVSEYILPGGSVSYHATVNAGPKGAICLPRGSIERMTLNSSR